MPASSDSLFEGARLRAPRLTRDAAELIAARYGDEESVRWLGVPPLREPNASGFRLGD